MIRVNLGVLEKQTVLEVMRITLALTVALTIVEINAS
jgi:hypothetical protein